MFNESNEASKAAFITELNEQLDSMPNTWWDEARNGLNCKSKWLSKSICQLLTYYDQYCTEPELKSLFRVVGNNHNIKLAIEKLVYLRMLKNSPTARVQ